MNATDDLAALWRWFADTQFRDESPIYDRIARAVADDRETLELLRQAPPPAHFPLTPLAAARYLLLGGIDHPLGEVCRGESRADPGPLFLEFCGSHRAALLEVLETRRVQTNDCGRGALIGPGLTWIASSQPGPFALVDVGASAGINLLCDRYRFEYPGFGATGPVDSPVRVTCEVRGGTPPLASSLPDLAHRVGIDLDPIDLSDPSDARWLLACVWPDSARVPRVEAAVRLAQQDPPRLIEGRANDVLPSMLRDLGGDLTAIVMTTWAFGYFSLEERAELVELLRAESRHRLVVWLSAENAGIVEAVTTTDDRDVLGAVVFDDGAMTPHVLAHVHPHGEWIDWR